MEKLLNEITQIFTKNDLDTLENKVKKVKLAYLYAFYHYYYGDEDYLLDVDDRMDFNNSLDNFANGFFEDDGFDEKVIDILTPYYIEENNTFEDKKVDRIIAQICDLVSSIKNNRYSSIGNESKIKEFWDPKDPDLKLNIRLITNFKPSFEEKNRIITKYSNKFFVDGIKGIEFVFGDDIEDEIAQLTSSKKCVESGEFILEKEENNFISYGEEKSIITNIKASSLKANYLRYGKSGLFAMNLRFYVPNKKVDEGLENTIKNHGDKFWYYNNGIIIICDDYKIEGNKLKLRNFSIVNGGQTTRMIGVIPFTKDFSISCKVIKTIYESGSQESAEFISSVAEASNTQKPINSADIIANKPEQRYLKDLLAKNGVFMQIKRGDSVGASLKENYPEPWQKTKNKELAQLLYGSIYQKPGSARSAVDKIFSDKRKYNLVFQNPSKYNVDLLKDLIKIKSYYKKWQTKIVKDPTTDSKKKGITKNGFHFFASALLALAKFKFSPALVNFLNNDCGINSEKGSFLVSRLTFNHQIFKENFKKSETAVFNLFNQIYINYISKAYDYIKNIKTDLVYSNFTKTDKNYSYVLGTIFEHFADSYISPKIENAINDVFYNPSEVELQNNIELLEKAKEDFVNKPVEVAEVDELYEEILDKLREYRTGKASLENKKASEIFSDKEMKNLATNKPRNIKEIASFGCFEKKPNTKVKLYGEDIVKLIKKIYGEE